MLDAKNKENKIDKKTRKEMKDQTSSIVTKLKTLFTNENYVYKSIEPLTAILTFHGSEFDMRKEYTSESQTASPFEEGKYLNSHNSYGVYGNNAENSITLVNVHTNTGWPTYGYNEQLTTSEGVKKVKKWEVEIILED